MRGARTTTQEHPDEARQWTDLGLRSDVCGELMLPPADDAARMAIADCAAHRAPEDLDDATGEPLHN